MPELTSTVPGSELWSELANMESQLPQGATVRYSKASLSSNGAIFAVGLMGIFEDVVANAPAYEGRDVDILIDYRE
jgi:hypothetical protein